MDEVEAAVAFTAAAAPALTGTTRLFGADEGKAAAASSVATAAAVVAIAAPALMDTARLSGAVEENTAAAPALTGTARPS